MKDYCFILASSDDRAHHLERCVKRMKESQYADADVYLFYQGKDEIPEKDFFKGIIVDENLRGIFTPRYQLMKTYCLDYEFTILIDDDLFMYPYTSYESSMAFLRFNNTAGCMSLGRHFDKVRDEIRQIDYAREDFNVNGGLVLPKRSVEIIVDYFKDKEKDYTEDMFWLLIYVKGYDLYRDFTSNAIHVCNQKSKTGDISGFRKMRYEKPRIPMLPEYVNERYEYSKMHGRELYMIPECRDVNIAGMIERRKCREKFK